MPQQKGATDKTRERVITALKMTKPGALSENGIKEVTGIHTRILKELLEEMIDLGLVEPIQVKKTPKFVYRWIKG